MRHNPRIARVLGLLLVIGLAGAGLSGCSRAVKADFAKAPEDRPLEIPPPLDVAGTPTVAAQAGAPAPARPSAAAAGFRVDGARDAVYARVGEVLDGIEGLAIVSKAELLGSYDVTYQGSSFLVRVVGDSQAAQVSAVDARGQQAAGEAPAAVLARLQAALVR